MKIYSYIKMDVDGNVIDSVYENYSGPIAECKGNVSVPPPTEEEVEIQRQILKEMQQSSAIRDQLLPFMLESTGYKYDSSGNIVKMPYSEFLETLDPLERSQYENLLTIQEKTAQALAGELPVSTQLEENIANERRAMEENLARKLGPDWELSSAGIASKSKFDTAAKMLREAARRGMVSEYTQLGYGGASTYGLTPQTSITQPAALTGYSASLIPTYESALQPYQQQRSLQLQADLQNAQNESSAWSMLLGGLGSGLGTGLGFKLMG